MLAIVSLSRTHKSVIKHVPDVEGQRPAMWHHEQLLRDWESRRHFPEAWHEVDILC